MKLIPIMVTLVLIMPNFVCSQDLSNYLILEDIGSYKRITKGGPSGSILAGAGHFGLDHKDKSYGIAYVNDETQIWVDVQVTQHAGSDSDKWLLHEIDRDFRNYYGLPGDSYVMRVMCVFRSIPDTHSGAIRTPIPFDSGQSFRSIPDTP